MALADWDRRLITPERALELAGDWPVYYTVAKAELSQFGELQADQWQINQRCGKCDQSIALLASGRADILANLTAGTFETGPHTTTGDQLSDVLRHLVTAHDLSLSGAPS